MRFRESRGSLAVQSVVASGRSRRSLGRTPGESANPAAAQGKRSRNEIFQEIPKNALCVRPSFRAILHRFTSSRRWICGIVALCVELGAVDIAHLNRVCNAAAPVRRTPSSQADLALHRESVRQGARRVNLMHREQIAEVEARSRSGTSPDTPGAGSRRIKLPGSLVLVLKPATLHSTCPACSKASDVWAILISRSYHSADFAVVGSGAPEHEAK